MGSGASLVGTSLAGRYDVLELLGEGGMGAVYRVLDRELDEVVALKIIRDELAGSRSIVERFRNEVKLARRVTHANVARTFEIGSADGLMFCTMELVDGEPLAARLERRGRLPIDEAIAIACGLCDGLAAAHAANVIHRDIKPDNVMIATDGRIVLTDFGVAALGVDQGESSGTPAYMAPEQALGEPPSPAADVYAVGVILFEMVTGSRAFTGSALQILATKETLPRLTVASIPIPAALADVIGRATERDPDHRLRTAAALRAALAPWLTEVTSARAARAAGDDSHQATVIVHAPRGDAGKMFLAEAVHGELLQGLARTPLVRVLARGDGGANTAVVELHVDDVLTVTATHPARPPLVMQLPLEVAHVAAIASSIAAAVIATLAPAPAPDEAIELLLQARHQAQHDIARFGVTIGRLERAASLAPDNALIAATLAAATLQRGFFDPKADDAMIARATELVRFAIAAAPALSETHLAAGQLELHTGEAATAAGHFRLAIACAPHSAMAHEQLGRMLLEAGHLAVGFARIDEALALAPELRSAGWLVARAYALEERWDDHHRLVAELSRHEDSLVGRMRFISWRGAFDDLREVRAEIAARQAFVPDLFESIFASVLDGKWLEYRDHLTALVHSSHRPSRRHRAFIAQLVAEAAGVVGDAERCERLIGHAVDEGLFDLHWLDRCPPLALARVRPAFAAMRDTVRRRADAILDALYGDHPVAPPARTQIATPAWFDPTTRFRTVKW